MSFADDLADLARDEMESKPDIALANAARAVALEPNHHYARSLVAQLNPYTWTGFATMIHPITIKLNERGFPLAEIYTPSYHELRAKDIIVHGNALYLGYGTTQQPTHLVRFDANGFGPLQQLPLRTQYIASNPEEPKLTFIREPTPSDIPIKYERDHVLVARPRGHGIDLSRTDGQTSRLVGHCNHFFSIDEFADAHMTSDGRWKKFDTGTTHDSVEITPLVELPACARYLHLNQADHPANAAALYGVLDGRVSRIGIEIPITLCDALRTEGERQIAAIRKRGIR